MRAKHFIQLAVVIMVVVGLGLGTAHAATISWLNDWPGYLDPYPSSSDLINAGQSTLSSTVLTTGTAVFGSLDKLNDGDYWGGLDPYTPASWETYSNGFAPSDGAIVTVALNTTVSPLGYDIDSIVTVSASSGPRLGQKFDLWYSLVANPDAFVLVTGDNGATVNRAGGPCAADVSTITGDSPIATGVAKLQFQFYSYDGANENVYREIDVFGAAVPEPGTLALLATGLIGLLCYAWRRRK